jgi:hypothetical protein
MAREQRASLDFLGTNRALNLPAPGSPEEPARLADLNAAVEGIKSKDPVRVATQGNINLSAPGAAIDGVTMASGDRFMPRAQTAQPENGLYIWNGPATPATRSADASTLDELKNAVVVVLEGSSAGVTYRQTTTTGVIGTANIVWASFGSGAPPASEGTPGIIATASQAEVDGGTVTNKAVVPEKLKNSIYARRSSGPTQIGDASATSFTVTHNLATKAVDVSVKRVAAPFEQVDVEWQATTVNTVTVLMAPAPSLNQYEVVVSAL